MRSAKQAIPAAMLTVCLILTTLACLRSATGNGSRLAVAVDEAKGQGCGGWTYCLWRAATDEQARVTPHAWRDDQGRSWIGAGTHGQRPNGDEFEGLAAGWYRASAWKRSGSGARAVVSEAVSLDGSDRLTTVHLAFEAGRPVRIEADDSATGAPIKGAVVSLFRADGFPIGNPNYPGIFAGDGVACFEQVSRGEYTARASRMHHGAAESDYPEKAATIHVESSGDEPVEARISITAVPLSRQEIDKRWPFVVSGRATDATGAPVADVQISVSTGMGSLWTSAITSTDKNGCYTARFDAGYDEGGHSSPVAVIVAATKSGFFEANLYRHGEFMTAGETRIRTRSPVLEPGKPQEVDFKMLPAAHVKGRVVGPTGEAVSGYRMFVKGEEMYPGASLMAMTTTSDEGGFDMELPAGKWWITSVDWGSPEVRTQTFETRSGETTEIELLCDPKVRKLEIK